MSASTRDLAEIERLLEVMDTLLAPGGCEWDREQTHRSLVQYCLEEAYEVAEAIETDDRVGLQEELGDLLLQVVFHSAIASHEDDAFSVGDVAKGIADKLIRRHPHIDGLKQFSAPPTAVDAAVARADDTGTVPYDADSRQVTWDRIKKAEKSRESVLDGIPVAQPALARAEKIIARSRRAELPVNPLEATAAISGDATEILGAKLMALAIEADAAGIDAEGALRQTTVRLTQAIVDKEKDFS